MTFFRAQLIIHSFFSLFMEFCHVRKISEGAVYLPEEAVYSAEEPPYFSVEAPYDFFQPLEVHQQMLHPHSTRDTLKIRVNHQCLSAL